MAMLDDIVTAPSLQYAIRDRIAVRDLISQQFWIWFHEHARDVVVERRVLWLRVVVRVEDLHDLFVLVFGRDKFYD